VHELPYFAMRQNALGFLGENTPVSLRNTPRRRPHGNMNFRSFAAVNGARFARRPQAAFAP
jgi:hypothetical protein